MKLLSLKPRRKRPDLSVRNTKHGLCFGENGKKTRLYSIWVRMRQRCSDHNSSDYEKYGGRGITICNEWLEYKTFHDWAHANGYQDTLTIERKDNNAHYEPENCTWIPAAEQARNKRNNHSITYNGENKILAEWGEILGIGTSLLRYRLKNWGVERALTQLVRNRPITHNSETRTITEWAEIQGVPVTTLQYRLNNWSVEDALTKPVKKYQKGGSPNETSHA